MYFLKIFLKPTKRTLHWRSAPTLDDPGNEPVRDDALVLVPVPPVLGLAHVIVPDGPVDQQDREVDGVVVRDNRAGAAKQAPAQAHDPVPGVVDLAGHPPPARRQKAGPPLGLQVRQMAHLGIAGICSLCGRPGVHRGYISPTKIHLLAG